MIQYKNLPTCHGSLYLIAVIQYKNLPTCYGSLYLIAVIQYKNLPTSAAKEQEAKEGQGTDAEIYLLLHKHARMVDYCVPLLPSSSKRHYIISYFMNIMPLLK